MVNYSLISLVQTQRQYHHDNQYAHGQITPVLTVATGGSILSILAFNRPNGTLKAFLSERLIMKDDMLVTLLSTPATARHVSLMATFISCNALSISDGSRTVSSVSRFISSTILHSGALTDSHIHRRTVGGECRRACWRCHEYSPIRCQTSVWKSRINAWLSVMVPLRGNSAVKLNTASRG